MLNRLFSIPQNRLHGKRDNFYIMYSITSRPMIGVQIVGLPWHRPRLKKR